MWPPVRAAARAPTRGRPYVRFGIWPKEPMPSGDAGTEEGADAAEVGAALRHQGAGGGRIGAMPKASAGAAGAALGRARARAQAAMQAAAAIGHGGLAAAAAGAGMGAAARRGQEIARTGTVPQPAAAVRRQAGGRGQRRKRAMKPMPSGRGVATGAVIWRPRKAFAVAKVRGMF